MQRVGHSWLLLSLGLALACGGRYQSGEHDEVDDGATGTAGTSATAGNSTCVAQQQAYADYREQLIAQFSSFACAQDSDCVVFYNQTSCDSSCVLTTTAARRGLIDGLNNFAVSNCSSDCQTVPAPLCGPPPPPHCAMGRCQLVR